MNRPDLSGPLTIAKPDWETYCHKVADLIVAEQSPARVMEVRGKFYELLSHCIPPTVILKVRLSFFRRCMSSFGGANCYILGADRGGACCGEGRREFKGRHHALGGDLCEYIRSVVE